MPQNVASHTGFCQNVPFPSAKGQWDELGLWKQYCSAHLNQAETSLGAILHPLSFLQYSQPPVSACCSVLVLSRVRLLWHFFCSLLYTSVEWLFYVGSWCCAKMVLTHFHPVSSLSFRNKAGPSGPNAGPPKQLTFPDEDRPRPSPFLVLAPAIGR